MITNALLSVINAALGFFIGLIPDSLNPPGWVSGSAAALVGFFSNAQSMGVWIPLDFAFLCAYALMSTYIGGGVVKMVRILISHFTGGGGSAA